MSLDHRCEEPTAIRSNVGAIFVSLELSRSTWLITSLSPGSGEKMSKYGSAGFPSPTVGTKVVFELRPSALGRATIRSQYENTPAGLPISRPGKRNWPPHESAN